VEQHCLVVNGVSAPFMRVFGCDCARCSLDVRQANTSVSLITRNSTGETIHHVLFDVGAGVTDSLIENPYLGGCRARVDWLALSHWHPDHVLELNRLTGSLVLSARTRDEMFRPIPVWCRRGTAEWLAHEHSYEWQSFLEPHVAGDNEPPGTLLAPVPLAIAGVTVTPVSVSHRNADRSVYDQRRKQYCCAAFVIATARARCVLLWDIDSENEWLVAPQTAEQEAAVALLANADYLFVDTLLWKAKSYPTNHASFSHVRRYARALLPRQTLLVHLSGHLDDPGNPGYGWSDGRWEEEASAVWQEEGLPGSVRVPHIGDVLTL